MAAMMSFYFVKFLLICAAAVAQLSPSGDVRVCVDAVVVLSCNISWPRAVLSWEVTLPGEQIPQVSFLEMNRLPDIGQPVPHEAPGVNVTICNITTTSITSKLFVDTSLYKISNDPFSVRCIGADGQASIRNLGLPNVDIVDMLHCIITDDNQVSLSWPQIADDDSMIALVEQYSLTLTPSPPSLTTPLITNTTTITLTLLRDTNYTVNITAHTCVGNITTRHNILTSACAGNLLPTTAVIHNSTTIAVHTYDHTTDSTSIQTEITIKPTASSSLTLVLPLMNGLVLVVVVMVNIAVCVALALCLSRKKQVHKTVQQCSSCKANITMEMTPRQVRSERSDAQGEPLYEDIISEDPKKFGDYIGKECSI